MHDILYDQITQATVLGYGSLFPQSPTSPDVVMASMDYLMALTRKRGIEITSITAD
jgi:hypothetical protein